MLILGVLYLIIVGLSFKFNMRISSNTSLEYKLDGVMLMKMICLCFLVGNGACGVYSQLEEKVYFFKCNALMI